MLLVCLGDVLLVGRVEITRQDDVPILADGLQASLLRKEGGREGGMKKDGREGRGERSKMSW